MPVEMRLEDAGAPVRAPARVSLTEAAAAPAGGESAPAALSDLIAARLVSHEVIGDPVRLGPEPATLRALCKLVAGPVYRLEPFHYAFAARDSDLGGALAGRDPAERTEALGAALAAVLGPEAVWLGATDLLPEAPAAAAQDALPEAALILLCAQDAAVTGGVALAEPGLRAVIDAHLATEAARRAADLAAALGLETETQAAARDAAAREAAAQAAAALDRRLAAIEARLETLMEARMDLPDAAAEARETRAFEARLGLALAEFLARLAELRRERAERLTRLRGGHEPSDAADPDSEPALAAFLRVLRAAIAEPPPPARTDPPAALEADPPAAEVLPFLRAPERAVARPAELPASKPAAPAAAPGDLDRLPGVGPGLVWALEQAGVARLADLAGCAPAPLADRLGPIGGLVDLSGWIAFARSATAPGAAPSA